MKKIALILTLGFIVSCNDDIVDGPAAGFYPTGVLTALEEDGVAYQVTLAATGELSQGGVVQIELDNHEFIETNPPHTNGKLQLNISSSGSGLMTVKALDDDIQGNYISTFRVTDTGGDITGIANSEFSFIVEDDDVIFLFGEDFESGLDDWEVEDLGTGNEWEDGEFSGNAYADVSNFQANGITESWILSPEIDFDAGENEVLTFDTQPRFNEGEETFEAYIVQGYTPGSDPSGFTIRQLSFEVDDHTGGGFGDFASSGKINVGDITGSARIAFYYKAGSAADGSGWSLDNVLISSFHPDNSDGVPNIIGGGGSGGGGDLQPDTDISDARTMDGAEVIIKGIVTTNDYGFTAGNYFIQDATGGIAITHFDNQGLVSVGDDVTLSGTVGDFNGQVQLVVDILQINSSGNSLPAAIAIAESDLNVSSQYQGMRVSLTSVTLDDESQWPTSPNTTSGGTNVDATFGATSFIIRIDRGESEFDGSPVPSQPFSLTGILGRFNNDVQVLPFFASDIN